MASFSGGIHLRATDDEVEVSVIARAQGGGTSGEIRGTITDPTGATVPKATVTVEDSEKGIRRTAVTETDGEYRVTGLPPASYTVTIETSGFQTEIQGRSP